MGRERMDKGKECTNEWSRVEKIMKDWKQIAQHF